MKVRALIIGLLVLAGCSDSTAATSVANEPAREPSANANTSPSSTELPEPRADTMLGVLVPEAEVVLVASDFSKLETLDLEVGDHVERDAIVAEMDVRSDQLELAAAKAAWDQARAELERLELELEKAKAERSDVEQLEDYVSKAELREQRFAEKLADARKRSAGASLSQQRSKMEEATARIAEAELRAPFSGVVASKYVDAGATLGVGDAIVRLISDAQVVRFAVPEERSGPLRLGAAVLIDFGDGQWIEGEVSSIAPEIEVGTRLVFAEAKLRSQAEIAVEHRVGTVARVRFR